MGRDVRRDEGDARTRGARVIALAIVIAIAAVVLVHEWWTWPVDDGGLGLATRHLLEDAERREARLR